MYSSSFESPMQYLFAQCSKNSILALLRYVITAQSNLTLYHTEANGASFFWQALKINLLVGLKPLCANGHIEKIVLFADHQIFLHLDHCTP